jgi:hypothetical protein
MARSSSRRTTKSSTRQSVRDKAREAADKRERGGGGLDTLQNIPREVEFFQPKMGRGNKGKNRFSIVPYIVSIDNHPFQEPGEPWPECTYWQHKIGVGSDSKRFICPAKTAQAKDKRCPICEYRAALLKSGQDPELADELKPKQRQIFNVLDHDDEDKGIQLFEISPHMFGFMLDDEDKAQAEDFGDRYYGDFENGLAILARFAEGSFGGSKFPECVRIDFEERDDLPEELVMEEAVDLDAALRVLDYDELNKKFFELESGEAEEEEDEPPARGRGRSRREKEEEPEPEEKSSRSRRSRQEEPEPKEEDEPEEKPRTRRSRREPEPEPEPADGECPAGLRFGHDCDSDEACDTCDVWDDCRDALDEIEANKRKRK